MQFRLMVSIPVHEKPEVVRDQVDNVLRFNPSSMVVLHVSREFVKPWFARSHSFEESERVLVNPNRFSTSKQGLAAIHLANYRYARQHREFDAFVLNASNDMYVKAGAEEYASRFEAVLRPVPLPDPSIWFHAASARSDPIFQELRRAFPNISVNASTPEGTAYPVDLMDEMTGLLSDYRGPTTPYPDEETLLPTLASQLTGSQGLPWVYSEVTVEQPLTITTIDAVRHGEVSAMHKTFYGDPVLRLLYHPDGLFAVKRVPRELDHPLRAHIRQLTYE